jgi:rod shape-determining protein MreC
LERREVAFRDNPLGELKVPLTWTAAVALIVAAIVAIALLATDRRGTFQAEAYGAGRKMGDAVAAPVGGVLSGPIRWTGAGIEAVRGYFFAVSENRRLKAELAEAAQWKDAALALRDVNQRYRTILGLKTDPPIPMITARIVMDVRGPFANTRLANVGTEKGVRPGYPVMSENGLVGRIIGVTEGASRVLLLTDIASRTPVMIDRTNARAILTGDGGPNPKLEYLRGQDPVRQGDRIVTSGDGGVLPRGLPVGTAAKGLDGRWRVVLASDAAPVDYVRILAFQDFAQLANHEELDRMPVPPPPSGGAATIGVVGQGAEPAAAAAGSAAAASAPKPAAPATPAAAKPRTPATTPPKPAASPKPAATPSTAAARPAAPTSATAPKPPGATTAAKPAPAKPPAATSAAARPASVKPTAAATAAPKPATAKPAASAPAKPPAATSAAAKPASVKPAAAATVPPKPATAKPAAAKPASAKPAPARPAASRSEAAKSGKPAEPHAPPPAAPKHPIDEPPL